MRIAFYCADDFNLGVAYMLAYLKQENEVRLFLENSLSPSRRSSFRLKEFNPDLVCFSCVTANYGWASQEAHKIEHLLPNVRILFGGVHPTLCPEEVRKDGFEVCVGDGIKYFGGKFEPDKLWADREPFFEQLPKVHREYQIFMTGFGCPFRCSFCNNHQLHRKLERRTIDGCIKELHYLKKGGMKYVLFDDDIFTLNRGWLVSFLHSYHNCVSLPFTCFGHTRYIDDEIAQTLKKSGCQTVWLGIQSGDEFIRRTVLNRFETNEEIKKASGVIRKAGLKLMIDHIFGLPNDNYETLLNSYNLYKEIKPDVINCYELLYFPKAEINKYGHSKALYQKQGGQDFKRYANSFSSLPLRYN